MVHFIFRNSQPKFPPKLGIFVLFYLIKNYAGSTELIEEKIILRDASYTIQQIY